MNVRRGGIEGQRGATSQLMSRRIERAERLDLGEGSLADAAASLDDMWRINRWLGGLRAITTHLFPRLLAHSGTATILDLGAGSAHLASYIAGWAAQHGRSVRILAGDINRRHLSIAQNVISSTSNVQLIQADALRLPFPRSGVDYLISSLFLHHLTPDKLIAVLREAFVCARRAVIFSDVVRGWLPWLGFKLSQPIFARSYLTRYDGGVSIQRAYSAPELRDLAAEAGLRGARVTEHPLWRMTLVADKP